MKVKQKTQLRPLRLIHLGGEQVNGSEPSVEDSMMKSDQSNKETKAVKEPENATTTFVPRVFAEHGRAAAAVLLRRLLAIRLVILTITVTIMLFTLPILSKLITALPVSGSAVIAAGLRSPSLLGHITPIAFWVLGNGITSLFTAIYASQMRMQIVFICGSIVQLLRLALSF